MLPRPPQYWAASARPSSQHDHPCLQCPMISSPAAPVCQMPGCALLHQRSAHAPDYAFMHGGENGTCAPRACERGLWKWLPHRMVGLQSASGWWRSAGSADARMAADVGAAAPKACSAPPPTPPLKCHLQAQEIVCKCSPYLTQNTLIVQDMHANSS